MWHYGYGSMVHKVMLIVKIWLIVDDCYRGIKALHAF